MFFENYFLKKGVVQQLSMLSAGIYKIFINIGIDTIVL